MKMTYLAGGVRTSILLRRMWDKFFRVSVLYRSDFKFTNISLLVAVEAIKDVLTPNE